MAEIQSSPGPRGRVYYSPKEPIEPLPERGYFQPRRPRPQVLRVGRPRYLGEAFAYTHKRRTLRRLLHGSVRLTDPRESVKRVLRLSKFGSLLQDRENQEELSPDTSAQQASTPSLVSSTRRSSLGESGSEFTRASSPELNHMAQRPPLVEEIRTVSGNGATNGSSISSGENEKPIASGNGVSVSIVLAEPILFLQGFDPADFEERNTTMLRGSLRIRVTKSAKIKTIYLKFKGRAETEWPEGIPPKKTEYKSVESLMNHTWPFFNATWQNAEFGHGADSVQPLKGPITTTTEIVPGLTSSTFGRSRENLTPKDLKRLSLQEAQSRSFSKSDTNVNQKGYRTFTPGDYIYNFELPIDSRLPETIDVELGRVKYELEAIVERAGAFRANLVGSKEVVMIRAPTEGSLETVEPIAISRDWEDQLHYDIVISGKSFPLGSQVPIAFKLTPLAKVRCHRIKVYITENIQYFTSNKRVHRLEPTRRIQLFEKRADATSTSTYPGSSLRIIAGGGVDYDSRDAAAQGDESVPRDQINLLGPLEGQHSSVGPTEMEMSVQLPSCHFMNDKEKAAQIHFDTTYSNIQVHHWIKIVMRLSRPDTEDPSRHRHFEISIDSPFHILSCRATQANISLPAYTSPDSTNAPPDLSVCGCPGAPHRRNTQSTVSSIQRNDSSGPHPAADAIAPPPAAHVNDHDRGVIRPMHLLRAPSFNPPPFSDEDPPPPLITPPPNYENAVDGDPRNALADYFSRLADEVGDEDVDVSMAARMEIPLTPGGRINRSMDERRTWEPVGNHVIAS